MWITRVSINNPVFATMVMVALCVLGLFSYARLGVEQMPDVSPPMAFVSVSYPGAAPEAVENEVTRPIESALNAIAGVKMIRSNSYEGYSETVVEFKLDADMTRAIQEVRDKVAVLAPSFPKDVKAPSVSRFDNELSQPVVTFALLGAERGRRELSLWADQTIRKRLERVEGVARVQVSGLTTRQIRVDLDPQRLRSYAVTPAEIGAALREANADMPVGLLSNAKQDATVRVEGRVRDPKQFAHVVVARRGAVVLTLADLGAITEREQEPTSISRVDGVSSIGFDVFKMQDANIVQTGEALKKAADELRQSLPPGVELKTTNASSDFVKDSLDGVKRTLVEGAALTVLIVFLFLHSWRSTVITGLTLPISVIASFIAVNAFGFTLNFMTMMALSLCIGLLIDDAIVVRENIVRHLGMGKGHHAAAREGTDEIGLAVMATTFAICAVFVPVAFMSGMVGKFFYPFGVTVTVAVLVSLFVSFTLDPMLSSLWRDPPASDPRRWRFVGAPLRAVDRGMEALHRVYALLIAWVFSDRRWRVWLPAVSPWQALRQRSLAPLRPRVATVTPRGIVVWTALALLAASFGIAGFIGFEGVPQTDQGFTQVAVTLPVGTSLERADDKMRQVEAIVRELPEIKMIATSVGNNGKGNLNIALKDRSERKRNQFQIQDDLRERLAKIPGIEVALGWNRPIYVAVLGPEPAVLDQITQDLAKRIGAIKGITDLETSVKPGLPAYAVRLKLDAIREIGLTAPQVASALRAYVNGDAATYWTTPDGQQVEVQLRLPRELRENIGQLGDLPVAYSKDGTPVALSRVADVVPVDNPEVIKRQNLQRRQAIYAGVKDRSTGEVSADVDKLTKATQLPSGYSFDIRGAGEEIDAIFKPMIAALGLSVIFIYIVLASQFGSFIQPLAIMVSLPLALIGVSLALLVTGSTMNLFSMIGLIMLMGLVTKNAILLVDFANQARKAGATVPQALLQAGQVRMRPIMMTTSAMVFGMLPLALALNEGGEFQAPMGRAIIGGVLTSTLLTLVVVPVIWSYLVRERQPAARTAPRAALGGAMGAHMPASKD
jgi:multidrug efflux pump subunit AcrB